MWKIRFLNVFNIINNKFNNLINIILKIFLKYYIFIRCYMCFVIIIFKFVNMNNVN